jgi:hypothetical protein
LFAFYLYAGDTPGFRRERASIEVDGYQENHGIAAKPVTDLV